MWQYSVDGQRDEPNKRAQPPTSRGPSRAEILDHCPMGLGNGAISQGMLVVVQGLCSDSRLNYRH